MPQEIVATERRSRFRFNFGPKTIFFIALWVVGLLVGGLFNGFEVSERDQRLFNEGMRKADLLRDLELEEDTYLARARLDESKTWMWKFGLDSEQDKIVQRNE
mgnify:CR=1 FL=1